MHRPPSEKLWLTPFRIQKRYTNSPENYAVLTVSKQRLKSSRPKVPVVGKCFGYSQPPHDRERNVVHNASAISLTTLVGQPRGLPVLGGWQDKMMARLHLLAQSADCGAVWPACGSVAAFEQDETACDQIRPITDQFRKTRLRRTMPLVAFIPERQQTNRVQKHGHGWCSLWRAATSCSPDW